MSLELAPEREEGRGRRRGQGGEAPVDAIILHVDPREFMEYILKQIRVEPGLEGFKEQIRAIFEELSEESDKFQKLVACLLKPHVSSPVDIMMDVRSQREFKTKLLSVISSARAVLERHLAEIMQEQRTLLDRARRGELSMLDEEVIRQAAEKMRQMFHLPIYVMIAVLMISIILKKLMYLNLPGHERSPVANILIGYEIIRLR